MFTVPNYCYVDGTHNTNECLGFNLKKINNNNAYKLDTQSSISENSFNPSYSIQNNIPDSKTDDEVYKLNISPSISSSMIYPKNSKDNEFKPVSPIQKQKNKINNLSRNNNIIKNSNLRYTHIKDKSKDIIVLKEKSKN
jgi:hypothetical protein